MSGENKEKIVARVVNIESRLGQQAILHSHGERTKERDELVKKKKLFSLAWKFGVGKAYYDRRALLEARRSLTQTAETEGSDQESTTNKVNSEIIKHIISAEEAGETEYSDKAGEGRLEKGEQISGRTKEMQEVEDEIRQIIVDYVATEGDENEARKKFFVSKEQALKRALGVKMDEAYCVKYADDIFDKALEVKSAVSHVRGIEKVKETAAAKLAGFEIHLATAMGEAKSEAKLGQLDRMLDRMHGTAWGSAIMHEAQASLITAGVVGGAVQLARSATMSKISHWYTFGATAVVGAGLAGWRRHKEFTKESYMHNLERELGLNYEEGKPRREFLERLRYKTESAAALINKLQVSIERGAEMSQEEIVQAIDILSDVNARLHISNERRVGLIAFSSPELATKEKRELYDLRDRLQTDLPKIITDKYQAEWSQPSNNFVPNAKDFKVFLQGKIKEKEEWLVSGEGGLEETSALFEKMRRRSALSSLAVASGVGLAIGGTARLVASEVQANYSGDKLGFFEAIFDRWFGNKAPAEDVHLTPLASLYARAFDVPVSTNVHLLEYAGPYHVQEVFGTSYKLPENVIIKHNDAGRFYFYDTETNQRLSEEFTPKSDGRLPKGIAEQLVKKHLNLGQPEPQVVNKGMARVPKEEIVQKDGPAKIVETPSWKKQSFNSPAEYLIAHQNDKNFIANIKIKYPDGYLENGNETGRGVTEQDLWQGGHNDSGLSADGRNFIYRVPERIFDKTPRFDGQPIDLDRGNISIFVTDQQGNNGWSFSLSREGEFNIPVNSPAGRFMKEGCLVRLLATDKDGNFFSLATEKVSGNGGGFDIQENIKEMMQVKVPQRISETTQTMISVPITETGYRVDSTSFIVTEGKPTTILHYHDLTEAPLMTMPTDIRSVTAEAGKYAEFSQRVATEENGVVKSSEGEKREGQEIKKQKNKKTKTTTDDKEGEKEKITAMAIKTTPKTKLNLSRVVGNLDLSGRLDNGPDENFVIRASENTEEKIAKYHEYYTQKGKNVPVVFIDDGQMTKEQENKLVKFIREIGTEENKIKYFVSKKRLTNQTTKDFLARYSRQAEILKGAEKIEEPAGKQLERSENKEPFDQIFSNPPLTNEITHGVLIYPGGNSEANIEALKRAGTGERGTKEIYIWDDNNFLSEDLETALREKKAQGFNIIKLTPNEWGNQSWAEYLEKRKKVDDFDSAGLKNINVFKPVRVEKGRLITESVYFVDKDIGVKNGKTEKKPINKPETESKRVRDLFAESRKMPKGMKRALAVNSIRFNDEQKLLQEMDNMKNYSDAEIYFIDEGKGVSEAVLKKLEELKRRGLNLVEVSPADSKDWKKFLQDRIIARENRQINDSELNKLTKDVAVMVPWFDRKSQKFTVKKFFAGERQIENKISEGQVKKEKAGEELARSIKKQVEAPGFVPKGLFVSKKENKMTPKVKTVYAIMPSDNEGAILAGLQNIDSLTSEVYVIGGKGQVQSLRPAIIEHLKSLKEAGAKIINATGSGDPQKNLEETIKDRKTSSRKKVDIVRIGKANNGGVSQKLEPLGGPTEKELPSVEEGKTSGLTKRYIKRILETEEKEMRVPRGEEWEVEKVIGATVVVSEGAKLKVSKNITGGKIIVEKGGELVTDGVKLTGSSIEKR